MKVLFLHKWLVMGGIERVLTNYLSLLDAEAEFNIDLLLDYDTEDNIFHHRIPNNVNIKYLFDKQYYAYRQNLYVEREKNLLKSIKYKWVNFQEKKKRRKTLTELILNNKYDLIVNFSNHFDPYLEFNKLHLPIIRWQHSSVESISRKESYLIKNYTCVIAICEDMKKQIIKYLNLPDQKVTVLFNPINTNEIIELSQKETKLDCPDGYLLQVARLDKGKRHSDLINIFSELVKLGRKEKLFIIGNGPEFDNLSQQIKHLNLQEKCFLLGEIKNPYPYMKNAKLFLHTSEREGLPTVLLESLILNTPVISTDCPTGPKEILAFGAGKLITLGNQEKFINETFNLLTNPEELKACKERIPETLSHFSEECIKKQFISLLKEQIEK